MKASSNNMKGPSTTSTEQKQQKKQNQRLGQLSINQDGTIRLSETQLQVSEVITNTN
jgi:hypothetical protein